LISLQIKAFNAWSEPNELFKMSWTLTADASTVIKGVLKFKGDPQSLLALADSANAALSVFNSILDFNCVDRTLTDVCHFIMCYRPQWFNTTTSGGQTRLANIFIVDHFQTSKAVQMIVDLMVNGQ
jgi:hypothetical protein